MRFPCEFISSMFLPGLRIRLAHSLREKGLSQNNIAELLGVKQPVIVSYLQKELIDTGDVRINHHLDSLADSISKMLYSNENIEHTMKTICTKCKSLRVKGPLCSLHKEHLPDIADLEDCDICVGYATLPSLHERSSIIQSLNSMISTIKKIPKFYFWVPEIGSQIASCNDEAHDLDDVASFPGRIIRVKEDVKNVSPPEFGYSKTAASLLLWMRKHNPDTKWLMTIKNRDPIKKILNSYDLKFLETESLDIKRNEILENLEREIRAKRMNIILDKGGPGYEAICYIFASSEQNLSSILKSVCKP